jgi:hypothetical protein
MTRRYRRPRWTKADERRIDAQLYELYSIDRDILRSKPPLDWLIDMVLRYRSICENYVNLDPDPKVREWYRKVLAGSDERWREIQALAEEQIAEYARRAEQARREVN